MDVDNTYMEHSEPASVKFDSFGDKAAKMAVTRSILQRVKAVQTVGSVSGSQIVDREQQRKCASALCDAGLIRHFGDSQYCITLKGLRFLDAVEQLERTAQLSPELASSIFDKMAM